GRACRLPPRRSAGIPARHAREIPGSPPALQGSASRPDRAPRAGAGGVRQDPGSQARRRSSMTDRAVGEGLRMYMVLCFERLAGRRIRPALPMRIEDSVTRTQMRRRIAMAIETPTHIKGGRLARQRHVTDRAVTFGAADAFGDMDRSE